MDLKDKLVVITGGSKGIGKTLAQRFKEEGSRIVILSHKEEALKETAQELGVEYIALDVRQESEVQKVADQIIEKFGGIDIWINNAGVFYSFSKSDELVDMEKANDMIQTNFFGTLFGCRAMLRRMDKGVIINILSTAALDSTRAKNAKIYAASKWATRGYLQAISAQNTNENLKILSVYPGGTKTDLYREALPDNYDDYMDPSYVVEKIISNIKQESPELELIIRRPNV